MRSLARQHGYSLIDTLAVVALIGVMSAMVIPITGGALRSHRINADTTSLKHSVGLAKMRAAAQFTRARVRVDLAANTYRVQVWDKDAAAWVDDGGPIVTGTGVTFGFGVLDTPPPDTQVDIDMSPPCTDGTTPDADEINGTACIVFNSRGLPVDRDGILFGGHALYLTSETGASAVTVTATPLVRAWMSPSKKAQWIEH
jgi:type II secretory pathway pseudopilin PulG